MHDLFGDEIIHQPQKEIFQDVIKSIGYDQDQMISDIIKLHCKSSIEVDLTYSIGGFYRGIIPPPAYKFDIEPQAEGVIKASSDDVPLDDECVNTVMYDPPFMSSGYKEDSEYKMVQRFGTAKNMGRLWRMYYATMKEANRILKPMGILIFKCQDCVDGRYNWFSHVEIANMAEKAGFYPRDLFILLAKSRIVSMQNQVHARKYHCYFWVLQKKPSYVKYGTGHKYDYNEQPGKRGNRKKRS